MLSALNAQFEPIPHVIRSEDLFENLVYEISTIRGVYTKYRPKIVVDLPEYGTLFLPNRYVKRFLTEGADPRRLNVRCENTVPELVGREDDKYRTPIFEFISNDVNGDDGEQDDAITSTQVKKKRADSQTQNGKQT